MDTTQPIPELPERPNRRPLITTVAAVFLCCFCIVLAVVGYYSFVTIRSVETQEFPTAEYPSIVTQEVMTLSPNSNPGEAPIGGLGNDILRNDTWQAVAAAAVGQGCDQPLGPDSTIEVLQEPDASGVWVEKWTVTCRSGDVYAFEVEYILDATGATFNIRSLP